MRDRNQTRWLIIGGLVVLAVLVVLPALFMTAMTGGGTAGPWMMGGYGPEGSANGWGWGRLLLFGVLLIGGLTLVIAWLFRQGYLGGGHVGSIGGPRDTSGVTSGSGDGGQRALDILKQRYARGEITKEVYEQMKRDILAD